MWDSKLPQKRLRDVLKRERRSFQPREGEVYRLVGVRWYGEGCHIHDEVAGDSLKAPSLNKLRAGDLVYNKMWASKGSFGVVGDDEDGAFATTEYPLFRPSNGATTSYLRHVLQQPRFWGIAKAWSSGSTGRARLDPHDFLTIPVPLPSPDEQGDIAAVLDAINLTIQLTRAYIDRLSKSKSAIMHALLTEGHPSYKTKLVPLPESWPVGRIASTVETMPSHWQLVTLTKIAKLESGHTPSRKHPEYWNGDIPWLSLPDSYRLDDLEVHDADGRITPAGIANSSARLLPKGAVLLIRTGGSRGKCSRLAKPMACSQDYVAFVPGSNLDSRYLQQVFRHMQREWQRLSDGSTTLRNIFMHAFKRLKILLPPLAEQTAIAEVGEGFDIRIAAESRYLEHLRQTKRGLAGALLSGRLRVTPGKANGTSGDARGQKHGR